jgi:predicted nuclease of predicted toxin-antitoxin system
MKLLVDMNLSPRWIGLLQDAGWEAVHWSAVGKVSAPDSEVMAYANSSLVASVLRPARTGLHHCGHHHETCPLVLEFRTVEDVSPRQHRLNAGPRRPLCAALLTSPLLTEYQDPTAAATGTGIRLRCRGVRACVNPILTRPPDLMSGGLVCSEDQFALVNLRELVASGQSQFLCHLFLSVVIQRSIHVGSPFDPIEGL